MTLLIPLLMRLTTLFERGVAKKELPGDDPSLADELAPETPDKE